MTEVITHPCHNFDGGLFESPFKLRHGWLIASTHLCGCDYVSVQLWKQRDPRYCNILHTTLLRYSRQHNKLLWLGYNGPCGHNYNVYITLQWRPNGRDGVSNNQPHDCLLNSLFRCRYKKTLKLHVTGLCEFPAQRAGNAENIPIWWRHHEMSVDVLGNSTVHSDIIYISIFMWNMYIILLSQLLLSCPMNTFINIFWTTHWLTQTLLMVVLIGNDIFRSKILQRRPFITHIL